MWSSARLFLHWGKRRSAMLVCIELTIIVGLSLRSSLQATLHQNLLTGVPAP